MKKNFLIPVLVLAATLNTQAQDSMRLHKDTIALKGVTIASSKQFVEMKPGKLVLNLASSPLAAGGNILEVLELAPGVKVDADGNISYNGKPVTVYIDGRPSYLHKEALKNLLTGTQGQLVDKIELISNPSARYDAAGGAMVHIRMKREKGLGTNGTATAAAGAGEYARANASVFLNHRARGLNVYGGIDGAYGKRSATREHTRGVNGFSVNGNENSVTESRNINLRGGLDYEFNKKSAAGLTFTLGYTGSQLSRADESRFYSHSPSADSVLTANTGGRNSTWIPAVNAYYKITLDSTGRSLAINGDAYAYRRDPENLFSTYSTHAQPYILRDHSAQEVSIQSLSADYTHPSKAGKFEAGIKAIHIQTETDTRWEEQTAKGWMNDAGKTNLFIYREWISAAYLNYSRGWGKWNLEAGARLEDTRTRGHSLTTGGSFTKHYLRFFPNAALQFSPDDHNEFSFSYRKSINRPGVSAVNPFLTFRSKYNYTRGNPELNPEIAHSLELMHGWKGILFTTLSYMRYNGVVTEVNEQEPGSQVLYNTYRNLSYSEWLFAGLTFSKALNKWWSMNAALQGGYVRYHYDTAALLKPSPGYFFSNVHSFSIPDWCNLQLAFNYSSRVSSGLDVMEPVWGVNMAVQRSILQKRGDLKLNVTDIFRSRKMGSIANYHGVQTGSNTYNDARAVTFTFTWRFGNSSVKANKTRKSGIENEKGRIGQ